MKKRYTGLDLYDFEECVLPTLPVIYQVEFDNKYCVAEYIFSRRYARHTFEPLVYKLNDIWGLLDEYVLMPISEATNKSAVCYTFSKEIARKIAEALQGTYENAC